MKKLIISAKQAYQLETDNGYLESRMTPEDRTLRDAETEEYIRKTVALLITPWLSTSLQGRFLELGCGHGTYASFFIHQVTHYTGYDIYLPSLQAAEARLQHCDNCSLIHGDGKTLKEISDQSQDFVFSFQTFVHMPDASIIQGYIKEVCRILSPSGVARLHILGPNFQNGSHIGWMPLAGLGLTPGSGVIRSMYKKGITFLQNKLPPDLLVPKLMGSPPDHPVWKIGATLNPLEAIRLVESQGCDALVARSPSGSPKESLWSAYWLTIYRDKPPFFATCTV